MVIRKLFDRRLFIKLITLVLNQPDRMNFEEMARGMSNERPKTAARAEAQHLHPLAIRALVKSHKFDHAPVSLLRK